MDKKLCVARTLRRKKKRRGKEVSKLQNFEFFRPPSNPPALHPSPLRLALSFCRGKKDYYYYHYCCCCYYYYYYWYAFLWLNLPSQ